MDQSTHLDVAYCFGGFSSRASGLVTVIEGYAKGLGTHNTAVHCHAVKCQNNGYTELNIAEPSTLNQHEGIWLKKLCWSKHLQKSLETQGDKFDIMHNHTVWTFPNHYASSIAKKKHIPIVFSPHGALEPWPIKNSRFKKKLIWNYFQGKDLRNATCFHVPTPHEIENLRKLGLKAPVAIIPYGVNIPKKDLSVERDEFFKDHPHLSGKKIILFLARLHEKKGLAPLIEAWKGQCRSFPDWHLLIVGNDDGYKEELEQTIKDSRLNMNVTVLEPMFGEAKTRVFAASNIFVLPSFSEGFSTAVIDALAHQVPALLSDRCNFPSLEKQGIGKVVSPRVKEIQRGLQQFMELKEEERKEMGVAARKFVQARYNWEVVSGQMRDLYTWLIQGNSPPSSFEIHFNK